MRALCKIKGIPLKRLTSHEVKDQKIYQGERFPFTVIVIDVTSRGPANSYFIARVSHDATPHFHLDRPHVLYHGAFSFTKDTKKEVLGTLKAELEEFLDQKVAELKEWLV